MIELKKLSVEKTHCNRFTLSEINGGNADNPNEQISPESTTRLMIEMRNCLQRKEYGDLSKLICMFTEMPLGTRRWYPTLIRVSSNFQCKLSSQKIICQTLISQYCLVALLYDPLVQGTGLLDLFLEGVIGCHNTDDKNAFLKDIGRMPETIHVAKFNELWKPHEDDDEHSFPANAMSVKKLCARLNKQTVDDHSSCTTSAAADDVDSDGWESFDENDSDGDSYGDGTTTEPENAVDLDDVLKKLETELGF